MGAARVADRHHGPGRPRRERGGTRSLLLDDQQRVTTLYGLVRGRPPALFEGDEGAFTGLRFTVETESFEFYGPVEMNDDPRWIDVTRGSSSRSR
jgi:hypothetical protein